MGKPPMVGKERTAIRNRTPTGWSIGDQFDHRACLPRPSGAWPECGRPPEQPNDTDEENDDGPTLGVSKAGGNPLCDNHTSLSPTNLTLPSSSCVRRSNGFKTWLSSTFVLRAAPGRLAGSSSIWSQRGDSSRSCGRRSNRSSSRTAPLSGRIYTEPRSQGDQGTMKRRLRCSEHKQWGGRGGSIRSPVVVRSQPRRKE